MSSLNCASLLIILCLFDLLPVLLLSLPSKACLANDHFHRPLHEPVHVDLYPPFLRSLRENRKVPGRRLPFWTDPAVHQSLLPFPGVFSCPSVYSIGHLLSFYLGKSVELSLHVSCRPPPTSYRTRVSVSRSILRCPGQLFGLGCLDVGLSHARVSIRPPLAYNSAGTLLRPRRGGRASAGVQRPVRSKRGVRRGEPGGAGRGGRASGPGASRAALPYKGPSRLRRRAGAGRTAAAAAAAAIGSGAPSGDWARRCSFALKVPIWRR